MPDNKLPSTPLSGPAPVPINTIDSDEVDRGVALRQMLRPVSKYMEDINVREITIPYPGTIFIRRSGDWEPRQASELTFDYLEALVATMAGYNEGVDFRPIMSLKLLDGERGQVMRPPAVLDGTISINIRKHSAIVKTLDELAIEGAFDNWVDVSGVINEPSLLSPADQELIGLLEQCDMQAFLDRAVNLGKNIIIGGKTGSGKTTFARSLIERIPPTERLMTIEDVHELFLPNHPNRVHMIYGKGEGQVSATECVEACMRSSPDRIFLSELRGNEAWEYLTALNTGHPGSVTTTHANNAPDIFNRVALLIKQSPAGNQIDVDTLRAFLLSTLDIALYFSQYKLTQVYFNPERASAFV